MVDLDSGSRFVIIFLKGDLSNMLCDMCVYVNSNLSNIIAINECQSHVLLLRLKINSGKVTSVCKMNCCNLFLLYDEVLITETVLMGEMYCSITKFSKKEINCKFDLQNRAWIFSFWEFLLICVRLWKGKLILNWIGSPTPSFAMHVKTFNTNCIAQVQTTYSEFRQSEKCDFAF